MAQRARWKRAGTGSRARETMRMHHRSCLCSPPPSSVCATSLRARRCGVLKAWAGTGRRTGDEESAKEVEEVEHDTLVSCLSTLLATSLRAHRCCVPRARGRMRWSEDHGGRVEQGRSGQQGTSDDASAPALRFRPACVPRVSELVPVEFQGRGNDWEQAAEAEYALDASLAPAGDHPPIGASEVNKGPTALCNDRKCNHRVRKQRCHRREAAQCVLMGGTIENRTDDRRGSRRRKSSSVEVVGA